MSGLEQGKVKNQNLLLELEEKFRQLGFKNLTDIQRKASPIIFQKIDSLVVAPTGSGKTETAIIPIFARVTKSKRLGKIKALYVTPLRALNRDVFRRIIKYDVEVKYIDGTITDVVDFIIDYVTKSYSDSPVLLFTNTRGESEYIASILKERTTAPIELHHGSLSQQVREETEATLREGKPGIVVCTSSLELGLDIGSVELVIHYGSPRQVSKLIQRIGRSKHRRGSSAKGVIVTNNADDEFEALAILERVKEKSIEDQVIHDGPLDVLAHHLVGMPMQFGTGAIESGLNMIRKAYYLRNITIQDLLSVLEILNNGSIIHFDKDEMVFRKKGRSFRYYFENLSTIPDILKFKVF